MIRPAKNHSLIVNEIFYSIQGESSHAGRPCVFIRLTFCNLRCSYCDTEYAFYEGREMGIDEIVNVVTQYGSKVVEVTGGEPLFQPNVHELLSRLCDDGYEALLETGGSLDVSPVDKRVKRIIDFKCPSSGMVKKNYWQNVEHLRPEDELKFVIGNREDYEWACAKLTEMGLPEKCSVLFSCVFGALDPAKLAGWILKDKLPVRFQLQLHKYIWHPETRGV